MEDLGDDEGDHFGANRGKAEENRQPMEAARMKEAYAVIYIWFVVGGTDCLLRASA